MKGQTIIVFGGGSGCGQAIAQALGKLGARIVIVGRRLGMLEQTVQAIEREGGAALAMSADARDEDAVGKVVQTTIERFGRIHAIVNAQGTNVPQRSVRTQSIKDFREIIDTNLTTCEITIKAVLTHLIDSGGGTIVNLGSICGNDVFLAVGPAYTASKHGLRALTRFVNTQYRHRGIRASHLAFGETETPLRHSSRKPSKVPLPPIMETEDVANAVIYMLSASPRAVVEEIYLNPAVLAPHLLHGAVPWGVSNDE